MDDIHPAEKETVFMTDKVEEVTTAIIDETQVGAALRIGKSIFGDNDKLFQQAVKAVHEEMLYELKARVETLEKKVEELDSLNAVEKGSILHEFLMAMKDTHSEAKRNALYNATARQWDPRKKDHVRKFLFDELQKLDDTSVAAIQAIGTGQRHKPAAMVITRRSGIIAAPYQALKELQEENRRAQLSDAHKEEGLKKIAHFTENEGPVKTALSAVMQRMTETSPPLVKLLTSSFPDLAPGHQSQVYLLTALGQSLAEFISDL